MFSIARAARRGSLGVFASARRSIANSTASQAGRQIPDSTSAIDYKSSHRSRPPPLPQSSPRNITAEEAVTNILYNTPPPSLEPFKKCTVFHLVSRVNAY